MEPVKSTKGRVFEYDFIKVLYAILIFSLHAMWYSGFYQQPIEDVGDFITLMFRNISSNGPLLFLITGCLMRNRKLSKTYYIGLFRIYIGFLLSALVVMWGRYYIYEYVKGNIWEILDFSISPYSWFICMYMGLYVLIPFLNVLYDNLSDKQRLALVITFCILTVLPSTVNIYSYNDNSLQVLFPAWWERLFPITFYYIGLWVSDQDFKLKKRYWALILIASVLIQTLIVCLLNDFGPYNLSIGDRDGDKCNLFSVINAICIFQLCRNINTNSRIIGKFFELSSKVMLETIIISVLVDTVFYSAPIPKLGIDSAIFTTLINRYGTYAWLFLSVPLCFILSVIVSLPIGAISNLLTKYFKKIISSHSEHRKDM